MAEKLSEFGEAALRYIDLGFAVEILKERSKEPATPHGVKDATRDKEVAREWWTRMPNGNVAIAGGSPSDGVCWFDFDSKPGKPGIDVFNDFQVDHPMPPTAVAKTGGGGYHIPYRFKEELHPFVNSELAVDFRAFNSYVGVAPSIHPSGARYEWVKPPWEVPVADADENVMAFLEHVRPKGKGGHAPKVDASEGMKRGSRNNTLYKMACGLMAQSWDDDAIIASIETYNANAKDPLPKHEVDKLLRSALSLPKGKSDEWYRERVEKPGKDGDATPRRGRPRKFNHADIADKLIADNGACFVDGMPAIRHGSVYRIGWNAINREVIALEREATRANQREVQHYLSVMAEQKRQSPPNLIAFKNGVFDIKTMELRDYEQDDVIPNVVPHDWNADAECGAVDAILDRMSCGDFDVYLNLIEVMGVCMYRSSEFTQSAILLGDGSNGKSTFIRMLTALLGKENISSLSMSQLDKQFLTGQLAGKLANLGSEISNEFKNGDLLSKFKELVDGNRTHADVKGVEGFDFESYATMVLCANEFPRLSDYSDGMMRRIFPIEFNARFKKTDPDYNPRIIYDVSTEEACERMAYLGVVGLLEVVKANGFTQNAASSRRLEEIKADNDSTLAWAMEMGWTADTLDGTPTSMHYGHYKQWCQEFGYRDVSHSKFTRMVKKNFGVSTEKRKSGGKTVNCFVKNGSTSIQMVLEPMLEK